MSHGQPVQHFPEHLPIRHELVHQRHEAAVVRRFHEMHHLMEPTHNKIFQAFARFLRKFALVLWLWRLRIGSFKNLIKFTTVEPYSTTIRAAVNFRSISHRIGPAPRRAHDG